MVFVYGLIDALHNQKRLVSFQGKPLMRMAVPRLIRVFHALSSRPMQIREVSETEFLRAAIHQVLTDIHVYCQFAQFPSAIPWNNPSIFHLTLLIQPPAMDPLEFYLQP